MFGLRNKKNNFSVTHPYLGACPIVRIPIYIRLVVCVTSFIFCFQNDFPILQGTFLLNQAVSRAMIGAKINNGSLVNISSIVGKVSYFGLCTLVYLFHTFIPSFEHLFPYHLSIFSHTFKR